MAKCLAFPDFSFFVDYKTYSITTYYKYEVYELDINAIFDPCGTLPILCTCSSMT